MKSSIVQYAMLVMLIASIGIGISNVFALKELRRDIDSVTAGGNRAIELPEIPVGGSSREHTHIVVETENAALDALAEKIVEEANSNKTFPTKMTFAIKVDWLEVVRGLDLETQLPQLPPEISDPNAWDTLSQTQREEVLNETMKVLQGWWNDLPEADKEKIADSLGGQIIEEIIRKYMHIEE